MVLGGFFELLIRFFWNDCCKIVSQKTVSGQYPEWARFRKTQSPKTQFRMGTISNGHNPQRRSSEWAQSRMDTIPNGHNPEWTQSRMDTIPNGYDPESTQFRMDTITDRHHREW